VFRQELSYFKSENNNQSEFVTEKIQLPTRREGDGEITLKISYHRKKDRLVPNYNLVLVYI